MCGAFALVSRLTFLQGLFAICTGHLSFINTPAVKQSHSCDIIRVMSTGGKKIVCNLLVYSRLTHTLKSTKTWSGMDGKFKAIIQI